MNPALTGTSRTLRRVYAPYTWLIYIPFLGVWTALMGSVAMLLAALVPRQAFWAGTAWARVLCWMNVTRVTLTGMENMRPGTSYVIMANHQSNFDVLALYGHWRRQFRWVMKQSLRTVPFLGRACDRLGHVFVDRRDRGRAVASLNEARSRIRDGISILFFPEGTRSADGRLLTFKKGGFVMAQDMGLEILPVSITGSYRVLPKGTLSLLPGHIRITIHAPIDPSNHGSDLDALINAVRGSITAGLSRWERNEGSASP
ncbi:MAG: lysophospholipid acyltransferase family protein [Pseudomonadota bacterium]